MTKLITMTKPITKAQTWVATRRQDETGANQAEYGLLVSFIALAAIGGVAAFGGVVASLFTVAI